MQLPIVQVIILLQLHLVRVQLFFC